MEFSVQEVFAEIGRLHMVEQRLRQTIQAQQEEQEKEKCDADCCASPDRD